MQNTLKIEDEIERKWLLRNNPFLHHSVDIQPDEIIDIVQWYVKIDGISKRIRKSIIISSEDLEREWVLIHKESISPGVNKEHHYQISAYEAEELINGNFDKVISKRRWVKHFDGFKIEVDCFEDIQLIMMEIELPSLDYKFEMPEFVKKHIICEMTGNKTFDNYNLAYGKEN